MISNSCLNDLKLKIEEFISISNSNFIFQATLQSIQQTLSFYLKKYLQSNILSKKILSLEEIQQVQKINKEIISLNNQAFNLYSDKYLNYLKSHSIKEIVLLLKAFCEDFNKFDLLFNLTDFTPFSYVPINLSDFSNLYTKLTDILNKADFSILPKEILTQRIWEINQIKNYLISKDKAEKTMEDQKRRILTEGEIVQILQPFSQYMLDYSDFQVEEIVGCGFFSKVYNGRRKSSGEPVAIKQYKSQEISINDIELFKHEIEILSSLSNPSILRFFGYSYSPSLTIFTEYLSHGNLFNFLRNSNDKSNPTKLTIIALGVAFGLSYLHSKKLLNRDIKSTNILLDENDYPKICDFGDCELIMSSADEQNGSNDNDNKNGVTINVNIDTDNEVIDSPNELNLADEKSSSSEFNPDVLKLSDDAENDYQIRYKNQKLLGPFGAARWMAPEVLGHHQYNEKSDVYSYGVILWEMVTRSIPWKGIDDFQIVNEVVHNNSQLNIPVETPIKLSNLISKCCSKNPKNRPSFEAIVRALASGDISFSGADHQIVEEYFNKISL